MPARVSRPARLGALTAATALVAGLGAVAPATAAASTARPSCSTAALTKASVAATKAGAGTPAPHRVGIYARVPGRVKKGTRLSVCGLVGTGKARTVRLERRSDGRWVRVAGVRAKRRVVLRGPVVRAPIVVRVTVRDARGRIVGASGARRVTLEPTRAPRKRTPKPAAPKPSVPAPAPAPPSVPVPEPGPIGPIDPGGLEPEPPDPLPGGSVRFETRWRDGGNQIVTRTVSAVPGTARDLDVDGDAVPDFSALVTLSGGKPTVDVTPLDASVPAAAVEAIVSDPEHHALDRDGLRLGFDAVDGRSPDAFIASADAGDGLAVAATQDAPAGQSAALVARVFDGTSGAPVDPVALRAEGDTLADLRIDATVDHATGTLGWTLTGTGGAPVGVASLRLAATATAEPGGSDAQLDAVSLDAPSAGTVTVAPPVAPGDGARLEWTGSAVSDELRVTRSGVDLLHGADHLAADVRGVPTGFTTTLREPDSDASSALLTVSVDGATEASGGPRIDQLRLAAGSGTMPAPSDDDQLTYRGGTSDEIALKLTNLKAASFAPAPFALALEHEDTLNGGTKPLDLDVSVPSSSAPLAPALGVAGTLSKPSFRTQVTAAPDGSANPKLAFAVTTGTAATPRSMASLTLTFANAGGSPASALTLANLPRTFTGCVAGDATCVSTAPADLPTALASFNPPDACTPKPLPASVTLNRPYAPGASFALDDAGTSGTSPALSSMVTVNASVAPSGGGAPTTLTNVRVHSLRGDIGGGATSFTFKPIVSISAGEVPRMYLYLDSSGVPFVLNGLSAAGLVSSLELGTDSNPAKASKRFSWVPGAVRGSILGCGVSQNIATSSSGTVSCGGQKELQLHTSIGTVNMFNLPLFGDVTNLC